MAEEEIQGIEEQKSKCKRIGAGLRQIEDSIKEVILLWGDLEEELGKEQQIQGIEEQKSDDKL